jgi:hypothetical protein
VQWLTKAVRFATGLPVFIFQKADFRSRQLGDYVPKVGTRSFGIFRVVEDISNDERERICTEALQLMEKAPRYNAFTYNCEHITNRLKSNSHSSYQVVEVFGNVFRFLLSLIAVCFLYMYSCDSSSLSVADRGNVTIDGQDPVFGASWFDAKSMRACVWAVWAFVGYHVLLTVPVSLHSCINLGRTVLFLRANQLRLSKIEFNHILLKEVFRVVFAGGVAVFTISVMPRMIWDTGMFLLAAVLAILAFHLSSQLYNVFAQLFTRLLYGVGRKYQDFEKRVNSPYVTKQLRPQTYNWY